MGQVSEFNGFTFGRLMAALLKIGDQVGMSTKEGIEAFLAGDVVVTIKNHVIRADAKVFVPQGWTVSSHCGLGKCQLVRRGADDLFLRPKEKVEILPLRDLFPADMSSYEQRARRRGKTLLNAPFLDYLLKHPEVIPDSWKPKGGRRFIIFLGTRYNVEAFRGKEYVRYLVCIQGEWEWGNMKMDSIRDAGDGVDPHTDEFLVAVSSSV